MHTILTHEDIASNEHMCLFDINTLLQRNKRLQFVKTLALCLLVLNHSARRRQETDLQACTAGWDWLRTDDLSLCLSGAVVCAHDRP
jgi:hypothetical protein